MAPDSHDLRERNPGLTRTIGIVTDAGKHHPITSGATSLLKIDGLHAHSADSDHVASLRGLNLTVDIGEIHAILSSPGPATSMLGAALMGNRQHTVSSGSIHLLGDDVTDWPVDERAKAGMFLGFGQPNQIPGLSILQLLHRALSARTGHTVSVLELRASIIDWSKRLGISPHLVDMPLDDRVSSADTRRGDLLQMALLSPELVLLDEANTADDDADDDRHSIVADAICTLKADRTTMGIIMITHDTRLLDQIRPDRVHVMIEGQIVESGGMDLAERFERDGCEAFGLAGV